MSSVCPQSVQSDCFTIVTTLFHHSILDFTIGGKYPFQCCLFLLGTSKSRLSSGPLKTGAYFITNKPGLRIQLSGFSFLRFSRDLRSFLLILYLLLTGKCYFRVFRSSERFDSVWSTLKRLGEFRGSSFPTTSIKALKWAGIAETPRNDSHKTNQW